MELGLPPDLQMLIVSKSLMESLEKQAFEQFTESNQTEMGAATPEETRWLVMFPKIAINGSKTLRSSFAGVSQPAERRPGVDRRAARPCAGARRRHACCASTPPFVLMTLRGKLYLRHGS